MSNSQFYTADRIFTGEEWIRNSAIEVAGGKILSVLRIDEISSDHRVQNFSKCLIVPAYLDLQIYGAKGRLLAVYPEQDSVRTLAEHCKVGGTAFCLPTVATNTKEVFLKSIAAVKMYLETGGEGVLGIHLEGPWLNPLKRGAHIESLIHKPTVNEVREILDAGKGVIKMITLAPEMCSDEVIDLILSDGIIISAGHSNAGYAEATRSFDRGVKSATHLFNAMSALHHREPGLPGAIFNHPRVMCSVIPDGHHVDFEVIRMAKKLMGERLFAITDAVTDTDKGYYPHSKAGDKYEASGVLSGSALTMNLALKNLVNRSGIALEEALRMCSLYPARLMGMADQIGMIAPGYLCRLVVLDEQLEIQSILFDAPSE